MLKLKFPNKYLLLQFITFLVLTGCNHKKKFENETNSLIKLENSSRQLQRVYIIVPNQGCDGCISTAEDFVKNNVNRFNNVKYIFTRINNLKLLKIKIGYSTIASPNIILDSFNRYKYSEEKNEIYPAIVYTNNQFVDSIDYQSPFQDGFVKLLENIN